VIAVAVYLAALALLLCLVRGGKLADRQDQ
jgi:hypothetical protein